MTDHCGGCPFSGCPTCRYKGGTDQSKPFEQQEFSGILGYNERADEAAPGGASTPTEGLTTGTSPSPLRPRR